MSLTVLNIAFPLAPVGPDSAGGAEQVLALLDQALVEQGHTSIVIASEGSQVYGRLEATPRVQGLLDDRARELAWSEHRRAITRVLEQERVDLIHLHGVDFDNYLPHPGVPALVTLHLPSSWYPANAFHPDRPHTYLHCVSAAQEQECPPNARLLPFIENGVPIERLQARYRKRDWVMALGRICPEKGFEIALDAARRAHVPILLAGQVYRYLEHERYYEREIAPRLDATRRFIGPIGFERKRRLLTSARALLVPSLVAETSSLVAMEALACGTPVIAFPNGALRDIVEPGVTGYLVHDEQEMAEAILAAHRLDPEACRRAARERFDARVCAGRYLELYRQLATVPSPVSNVLTPA